jgi:hypothetical protein
MIVVRYPLGIRRQNFKIKIRLFENSETPAEPLAFWRKRAEKKCP